MRSSGLALSCCNRKSSPIFPGGHKHQGCNLYRYEHSWFHLERHGGLCAHPKRYNPKHRHCLLRKHLFFTDVLWMITGSEFSRNQITPTIILEAKPGLIHKKNNHPVMRRPVYMLMCSLQTSLLCHDVSGMQMASRQSIFVKPSTHG